MVYAAGRSIQKERKFFRTGSSVEVHRFARERLGPEGASTLQVRCWPQVFGGGAVTPDLIVKPDTFTTAEQTFLKATAAKSQDIYVTFTTTRWS